MKSVKLVGSNVRSQKLCSIFNHKKKTELKKNVVFRFLSQFCSVQFFCLFVCFFRSRFSANLTRLLHKFQIIVFSTGTKRLFLSEGDSDLAAPQALFPICWEPGGPSA